MKEWIYGRRTVLEHLSLLPENSEKLYFAQGSKPDPELFSAASVAGVKVEMVPRSRIEQLAPNANHQGVAMLVGGFDYADEEALVERAARPEGTPLIIALDGVQDPRNLGAVLRVADGVGAAGVVIPKDRAAGLTAVVARCAAGAAASVPVSRVVNMARALDSFKERGFWLLGASHKAAKTVHEVEARFPAVLVLGSESGGIRPNVASRLDVEARLPMLGAVSSLNISVAAGVFAYEILRRRKSEKK